LISKTFRWITAAIIAVAAVVLPHVPANASFPAEADQLLYAKFSVSPGDVLTVTADLESWNPPVTIFEGFSATGSDGAISGAFKEQYYDDHVTVAVRTGDATTTVVHTDDPRGCCFGYLHQDVVGSSVAPNSSGRYAFAAWGSTFQVHLALNGNELPLTVGDPANAFRASAFDFVGGAAVAGPQSEAAVASMFERTSRGHLLAVFASNFVGTGSVTDPSGHTRTMVSLPASVIAQGIAADTDGVWKYQLDAEASVFSDDSPIVVGVELP